MATYASRLNIQLLKGSDFNEKLRRKKRSEGRDLPENMLIGEKREGVRGLFEAIWENTAESEEILNKAAEKNRKVYDLEKALENRSL